MHQHLEQQREAAAATRADAVATRTGAVGATARRSDASSGEHAHMFGDVDPKLRLRMELVARASVSPETALPVVVALLVEGDERRAAIITALNENDALQAQWHATWHALRR